MAEATIKKMLKEFGLTDTESEVYLFLSKYGVSKGTQIAKQTKKDKAQIYHALKNLVVKGLAESTLESPVRYTAVAFENIVESAIKAKQEEAVKIQNTKQELLDYWKNLSKQPIELPIEKFAVIEGRPKVYARITQMLKDAKKQIVTITTVPNLIRAEQFGLYDVASKNPLKSQIQFRFITDFSEQDVKSTQRILNKMSKRGFNFKGKTPQLGQSLFPQMVIRDGEEAVFFINPNGQEITADIRDDICLWTNCRSLVQAFRIVFEEYWHDSKDFQEDIIETEKPSGEPVLIFDSNKAQRLYFEILKNAQKEILAVTSSSGLVELGNLLKKIHSKESIPIRIMAPIESGNINFAQTHSDSIEVRHVPRSNLETTIVDGKYVFQFKVLEKKKASLDVNQLGEELNFRDIYYSDDAKYAEKAKALLEIFWNKTKPPYPPALGAINQSNISPLSETEDPLVRINRKIEGATIIDTGHKLPITEKEILEKVFSQKSIQTTSKGAIAKTYGSNAQAIVHTPPQFALPTLLFHILHIDKQSTFGAEDVLAIHFLLDTPIGEAFVPVALLTDNADTVDFWKRFLGGSPAAQNIQLIAKDKLEIMIHGNLLFVAWTVPISVPPYTIPPSGVLIEGSGTIKPSTFTIKAPSGFKMKTEYNGCDGFVTYLHPLSKYSGPGTDGLLGRDAIMEFYSPEKSP